MTSRSKDTEATPYPRDLDLVLTEIEKEPVPERLLALAKELQAALVARRQSMENTADPSPVSESEARERQHIADQRS